MPKQTRFTKVRTEIRRSLGLKSKASKRSCLSWSFVADNGDMLSGATSRAIYGVQWAMATGRLSATAEMTVRKMTAWEFSGLIGELVSREVAQGETARWLNAMFTKPR